MKKVAALGLILSLLGSLAPAQRSAALSWQQPRLYTPKLNTNQPDDDHRADYVDERDRRRGRRRDERDPDYARPTHLIEMGLRVAPGLSLNTATGTGDYAQFAPHGAGVRFSVGPTLDYFFFKDRYAFSTGLWYTIKRSGYEMPGSFGQPRWNPSAPPQASVYNLQYVQVPLSAKLFANNVAENVRLYVQTGGLLELKLSERALNQAENGLYRHAENTGRSRQYGFADVSALLGAGLQYKLNGTNALNVGLSYQRGLLDVARGRNLVSKNRLVALEVGFQF